MRPVSQTLTTTTGAYPPVVLDYVQAPFAVGLFLDFASATNFSVTVQYSFDDPWATYATDYGTNGTWFSDPNLTTKSANADGNLAFPVRAVRANVVSGDSGTVKFTVIQAVKGS